MEVPPRLLVSFCFDLLQSCFILCRYLSRGAVFISFQSTMNLPFLTQAAHTGTRLPFVFF